jgi:endonuclease/exonuclease/phosphatase family metal-dependent hydrolase
MGIFLYLSTSARGKSPTPADTRLLSGAPVSIMTYNVKGLPWPVAWGRPAALRAISNRLLELRHQGHAPNIVVLQEAFTGAAQAIGRDAGYRYVVNGPSRSDKEDMPGSAEDGSFIAGAQWEKGETEGKLLGSGLQLMSDYPVVKVRRMTYPPFACAGFDCLANKGALLVTIRVPDSVSPIDIVTTHLNSRGASGVSDNRSLHAYARQGALLTAFINRYHDPSYPLVVAGDFNVGSGAPRRRALGAQIAGWYRKGEILSALHEAAAHRAIEANAVPPDALTALYRAKDWQFFASGRRMRLRMVGVRVPFGREADGGMLSDHIGYTSVFTLEGQEPGRPRSQAVPG